MAKFVIKYIHHVTANSPYYIRPFSSSFSLKSKENCLNQSSFTVDYLINSCGLTPIKAVSASKHVNFKVADKPNSVLTFFKEHGFTQTQVSRIIYFIPSLLLSNPQKTLLPKIEFFRSKGASVSDIVDAVSKHPGLLTRSLENNIIPAFNFFSSFLHSNKKTITAFRRFTRPWYNKEYVEINIEILKQVGVPVKKIGYLVTMGPKAFLMSHNGFREIVEEVKKLGFNPVKTNFLVAIHALNSMSKTTWDRKVTVYKHWGWSDNDVIAAFKTHPWCMTNSEDKITKVMEFWVNKMGWKSSLLVNRSQVLSYSLEKRIVPRCEVYQFLVSNGLLNSADIAAVSMIRYTENRFLQRFIDTYKEEAPALLKLYKQKLDLAQ